MTESSVAARSATNFFNSRTAPSKLSVFRPRIGAHQVRFQSLFFSKSLKRGLATAGLFAPEVAGMEQAPEEEGKAGYGSADASKP